MQTFLMQGDVQPPNRILIHLKQACNPRKINLDQKKDLKLSTYGLSWATVVSEHL